MTIYHIGAGIANITDPAMGQGMQGMADPSQKVTGVESNLYARTFIIADPNSGKRVVLVTADIWAGTRVIKIKTLERLRSQFQATYTINNVLISGTHTHSAPGGFSNSRLYEYACGDYDPHTVECLVSGIVTSIKKAHQNMAPGKIYINQGTIADCGRQRSRDAYLRNPASERKQYPHDTDKEMLLLKFVKIDGSNELPIGVLNWYAIHPTDRGQKNGLITGDNKGHASSLFERALGTDYRAQATFVAAFANANCGDVSGNVEFGHIPDGIHDKAHMELHGQKQFNKAKELFDTASQELQGTIDYRHTHVNMSQVRVGGKRTWPAGLGLAFAAGSTEDSVPRISIGAITIDSFRLKEGLREDNLSVTERAAQGIIVGGLATTFGITNNNPEFVKGHLPKPLILAPGLLNPPITPPILPLQLIQIGTLVLTAIPGEITTMAGRRLKKTVLDVLQGSGINHVALATYANDYSQYITTKEEYEAQHYEGASNLFGPYTLLAYQQAFQKLAQALKEGNPVDEGPTPSAGSAPVARRVTIRNRSAAPVVLEFFKQSDDVVGGIFSFLAVPIGDKKHTVPGHGEYAWVLPSDVSEAKVRLNGNDSKIVQHIGLHSLVTIAANGQGSVSAYRPPHSS